MKKRQVRIRVPDEHRDRNREILQAASKADKMLRWGFEVSIHDQSMILSSGGPLVYLSRTIRVGPSRANFACTPAIS
jgi:hypothetical protein